METVCLVPGNALRGSARLPGSKSIAQRLLLAASLAQGRTRLTALPSSADVLSARGLVEGVGASLSVLAPAALSIAGLPPGPHRGWRSEQPLELGESGTLARLATAAASLCGMSGREMTLRPGGTLQQRRSAPLFAALRRAGVPLEHLGPAEGWPVRVRPIGPPSELLLEHPISSQELSALLLALSAWPDETQIRVAGTLPSRPYVDLTRSVLEQMGARVFGSEACWSVRGPLRAPADPVRIEPDASAAAVLLAAAVVSEGEVRVEGLGSRSAQGDWRIIEFLKALGGDCVADEQSLLASGRVRRTATLSLEGHPDLAPVLAGVGAAHAWRGGEALRLEGLGTLPRKESSRIEVLARGFRQAGLEVRHGSDWMEVGPRLASSAQPVLLDPAGDHRMVFAFALLGLVRPETAIAEPACVTKSWPGFFDELCRLGARLATR